jgi:hypothetical protein
VDAFLDMPERSIDLLFRFLNQHGGHLSRRARQREFAKLTDHEASRVETIYRDSFGNEHR